MSVGIYPLPIIAIRILVTISRTPYVDILPDVLKCSYLPYFSLFYWNTRNVEYSAREMHHLCQDDVV